MNNFLISWGSNSNRELLIPFPSGLLTGVNSNISSGGRDAQKISLGLNHGLVQLNDSQIGTYITGWGNNNFNQYSIKNNFIYKNFEAADEASYLVDTVGRIHFYGKTPFSNFNSLTGQIINWPLNTSESPISVQSLLLYARDFNSISVGSGYFLALNVSGKITGWGESGHPVINYNKLLEINNKGFITGISAGYSHALAIFKDGTVTGWGNNSLDQLSFDNQFFFSGVKTSTKANHNMMIGLISPIITGVNSGASVSNWIIKHTPTNENVTGLNIQYSIDNSNWINNIYSGNLLNNNQNFISGDGYPTSNNDYYLRIVELENSFCQDRGWSPVLLPNLWSGNGSTTGNTSLFLDIKMSIDGKTRLAAVKTGISTAVSRAFLSYDYGRSWSVITGFSINQNYQSRFAMSNDATVMSLISDNQLFISYNSGFNWSGVTNLPVGGSQYSAVDMSFDGKCHSIFKEGNSLYLSYDSGHSWSGSANLSGLSLFIRSVAISNDGRNQIICRESSPNGIFISSDSGVNWTGKTLPSPRFVDISKNGSIQAVATSLNGIFISYNYGKNFVRLTASNFLSTRGISMSSNGRYLCAVGSNTPIAISRNFGQTWEYIPLNRSWFSSSISDDGKYIAAVTIPGVNPAPAFYSFQNCNFGLNAISGGIQKTGSTTIFNPVTQKFNINNDYRLYNWPNFTFEQEWEKNLFWQNKISTNLSGSVLNNILFDRSGQNQILDYGAQILQTFDYGKSWFPQETVSFENAYLTGFLMSWSPTGNNLNLTFSSNISGVPITGSLQNINVAFRVYNTNTLYYKYNLSTGNFVIFDENNYSTTPFTGINLFRNVQTHSSNLYTVMISETGNFVNQSSNRGSGELVVFSGNLNPSRNITGFLKTGLYNTGDFLFQNIKFYWEKAKITDEKIIYGIVKNDNNEKFLSSLILNSDGRNLFSGDFLNISSGYRNWIDIDISENGEYQTVLDQNGYIYVSQNYGYDWKKANYTSGTWLKLAVSKNGKFQGIIQNINNNYDVLLSKDYGETWSKSNFSGQWKNLAVSDNGLFGIIDNSNIYYKTIIDNKSLTESLSGEKVNDISAGYNYNLALTEKQLSTGSLKFETSLPAEGISAFELLGSDFDYTTFNEVYYFDEIYNNKPSYLSDSFNLIRWSENRWNIYYRYKNLAFVSFEDTLYPSEVSRQSWSGLTAYGDFGNLRIFTTGVIISCSGFIFDS
jgi:photosystem II stability/assembly factor-like uncharacterized protein